MSLPVHASTITLLIPNMHCPSCVETITNLLAPLEAISDLNISLLLHTVTFTLDPYSPGSSAGKPDQVVEKAADTLRREGGFIVESPDADTRSTQTSTTRRGLLEWASEHLSSAKKKERLERDREERRRELHLAHCEACREGRPHEEEDAGGDAIIRTTLSIAGMTCASCTQSIGSALRTNPAVLAVDINLLSSSGVVRHRASLSSDAIKEAIEDAGFDAEVIDAGPASLEKGKARAVETLRTVISIEGMTCSSCSSAVFKALDGVEGIDTVSVDVLGNKATIKHSSTLPPTAICEMIEDIGYGAAVASSESASESPTMQRRVKVIVHGIYCQHCITKLNAHLDSLDLTFTPFSTANHTTDITYTPRAPYTIRDILADLSNVSPEFDAAVVRETSLGDRSRDIQKREVRILLVHWIVAFILTIPTFIIAIVGMALLPSDNHFRTVWMRPVWGAAELGTMVIWPIATVVQFGVGRLFYQRAFASMRPHLRRLSAWILRRPGRRSTSIASFGWRSFFNFGSMDLLVVLSTTVSYFASLAMLIIDVTSPGLESVGSYFDSCVFLIMFILLGRVLEAYAKSRTTDAVSLLGQLRPETALLVENSKELELHQVTSSTSSEGPSATSTRSVPVEHLEKGDSILIPPGSLPPTDGVIVSGHSTFDESSLTGESKPVKKGPGDEVFTGTTNLSGAVTISITTTSGETMLEKIMRAVSDASGHKAPIEKLAERLTGVFVPIIIYLALVVLVIWLTLAGTGVLAGKHDGQGGGTYFFAIEFAIATLVVACPCGIGLAVPCANAVGTGVVAKEGVLAATGGEAFLGATQVDVVVLDKTGTLTEGRSSVTDARWFGSSYIGEKGEISLGAIVREVENGSTHPLAQGIVVYLDGSATSPGLVEVLDTREIAGRGLQAKVSAGEKTFSVLIGNVALMTDNGVALSAAQEAIIQQWSAEAKSVVLVALRPDPDSAAYHLATAYALSDPPRQTTPAALASLRKLGLEVKMLSGDNLATAQAVGKMVGIESQDVIAGVGPEGKADVIRALQAQAVDGKLSRLRGLLTRVPFARRLLAASQDQPRRVMFVGDGLNDSVALAAADVSVAMGHGSQATLAGSDFVLLSSSLAALPTLIRSSRKITRRQKLNLGWACLFNVVCLPFAAGVFYGAGGIRLTPVWSAVVMACSSLSVVCSSLALRWGI